MDNLFITDVKHSVTPVILQIADDITGLQNILDLLHHISLFLFSKLLINGQNVHILCSLFAECHRKNILRCDSLAKDHIPKSGNQNGSLATAGNGQKQVCAVNRLNRSFLLLIQSNVILITE